MQYAELGVQRKDRLHRPIDVLERATAGRQEHRLTEIGDVPEERHVQEVARGELEGVDVELRQEVRARLVECSGNERDPFLARVAREFEPVALVELERLAVFPVRRTEAVLVVVGRLVERAREEAAVVAFLELDRVDAALLRRVDQRSCLLDLALVVVPDLRDDIRGLVVGDPPPVHKELQHGQDATARLGRRRSSLSSLSPRKALDEPSHGRRRLDVLAARYPRAAARPLYAARTDPRWDEQTRDTILDRLGRPPTAEATTGRPNAIASRATTPYPSR